MTYYAAPGVLKSATRAYTFKDIEKVVCKYYKVDRETLYDPCRKAEIVMVRHVIAFLSLELLHIGTSELGKKMKRNHSTIVRSREVVNNYIFSNKRFAREIETIRKLIRNARFDI